MREFVPGRYSHQTISSGLESGYRVGCVAIHGSDPFLSSRGNARKYGIRIHKCRYSILGSGCAGQSIAEMCLVVVVVGDTTDAYRHIQCLMSCSCNVLQPPWAFSSWSLDGVILATRRARISTFGSVGRSLGLG